jgi:hypothetical protein
MVANYLCNFDIYFWIKEVIYNSFEVFFGPYEDLKFYFLSL